MTLLPVSAATLATTTVDYRHEYRLRDRTHYDKLGLSTTLPNNMFIGIETKYKTGGADPKDKFYNDTVLNVVEVTFLKSYYWGKWTLSPFIQPEFNSARTEWKFGVAPWYKINDRWVIGGLYRLELTDYAHEDKCRTGGIDYCDTDRHRTANRFDIYLRNKSDRLTTTYKLVYKHADAKLYAKSTMIMSRSCSSITRSATIAPGCRTLPSAISAARRPPANASCVCAPAFSTTTVNRCSGGQPCPPRRGLALRQLAQVLENLT